MRPLASAPLAEGRISDGTDTTAMNVRKKLEQISRKYNAGVESVAVAWILKLGALPLIGTMDEDRIHNVVKAFDVNLDKEDWYELYDTSRKGQS